MASLPMQRTRAHILIVGAGLAGLTLAQCLRKNDIPFSIFEREGESSARAQGWSIALHSILPELLESLPDDMPDIAQVDHLLPYNLPAEISFFVHGKKFHVKSTAESKIIRANRAKLRSWLLTKIPVQWGTIIKSISFAETAGDGRIKLVVQRKDESIVDVCGDVLVGADGVNSQVRNFLVENARLSVDLRRFPAGSIIGGPLVDDSLLQNQLQLSHSAYVAVNEDQSSHIFVGLKRILSSEDDYNSDHDRQQVQCAQYYWFLNWYDETAAEASDAEPYWTQNASREELRNYALEKCTQLDPKLADIVLRSEAEDIRIPPLVLRDVAITKMPSSRITLMGDAAHAMMPFRGEGGLHAMEDALKLGKALDDVASSGEGLMEALASYQDEMLSRGHEAMKKSKEAFSGKGGQSQQVWGNNLSEA